MSDPIHEQLSAFQDGELSSAESELLLKRLQRDSQLRATVGRYALIGEALRSTEAGGPTKDFAARVAQAIESESSPQLSWRPVVGWLKPVAGGAIAAGVAAVALVSLRFSPNQRPNEMAAQPAAASAEVVQIVPQTVAVKSESMPSYTVPVNNVNRAAPPIQVINGGRLANFVMAHSEYSSPLGQRNVLTGLLIEDPAAEQNETQPIAQSARKDRVPAAR